MKYSLKFIIAALICLGLIATGCSSKKVFCGCPNERGFVGYK
jgi:hypothetical protein